MPSLALAASPDSLLPKDSDDKPTGTLGRQSTFLERLIEPCIMLTSSCAGPIDQRLTRAMTATGALEVDQGAREARLVEEDAAPQWRCVSVLESLPWGQTFCFRRQILAAVLQL